LKLLRTLFGTILSNVDRKGQRTNAGTAGRQQQQQDAALRTGEKTGGWKTEKRGKKGSVHLLDIYSPGAKKEVDKGGEINGYLWMGKRERGSRGFRKYRILGSRIVGVRIHGRPTEVGALVPICPLGHPKLLQTEDGEEKNTDLMARHAHVPRRGKNHGTGGRLAG